MNKAYKVSHILDDVLEAYDDEMGIDPDSYYVVNDGEIIDGPFDTEDEANRASENDYDEVVYGADYLEPGDDEDEYEEDYDIYEEEGEGGGEKKKGCGKGNRRSKSKLARPGQCYAIRKGVKGRPRGDNCAPFQRNSNVRGCYDPQKGKRGRPKGLSVKSVKGMQQSESLASSIIRKINSF